MEITLLIGLLTMLATTLKTTVKNPASLAKIRKPCLVIYKTLKGAFADDPDFE